MSSPSRKRFVAGSDRILLLATLVLTALALSPATPADAAGTDTTSVAVPLKLPPDRVYEGSVGPDSAVTFSHATHVDYESNRCTGCHPKLFRILGPSPLNTHEVMDRGGSCGSCHDGKHAFDVRAKESCLSCHAGRRPVKAAALAGAEAPAAFSGPKPFVFKSGSASPGTVTFRHESHRGKGQTCKSCHSKLFAMKPLVQDPNADYHERGRCGACHDGKQSFGVEDDDACGKCHVEGKGGK